MLHFSQLLDLKSNCFTHPDDAIVLGIKFRIARVSLRTYPIRHPSFFGSPAPDLASVAYILATLTAVHFPQTRHPLCANSPPEATNPPLPSPFSIQPHPPLIPLLHRRLHRETSDVSSPRLGSHRICAVVLGGTTALESAGSPGSALPLTLTSDSSPGSGLST